MGMLRETKGGKLSSKRVSGFFLLLVCVILFVWKEAKALEITNKDIFINMMILAVILLGLDIAKYLTALNDLKKPKP